ncbi:uncharacterized protein LOC127803222 [Diospyros lotus]|uniref:uncharacterized protein LOC127803222 n=1 Tax=Diospyros lotus TaxID=55363 RepID=UPI00224CB5EB|nr:uncharacterized protein LOC127803222 [Diospyros lotus]
MKVTCHNRRELIRCLRQNPTQPKVIVFTATWSTPCRIMEPFLDNLYRRYQNVADFLYADVDELESLARQLEITDQLPTVILLKNGGDEEEWFSGADNEELQRLFQGFFR